MTDHAQAARRVVDEIYGPRSDGNMGATYDEYVKIATDAITQAHDAGRRAGLEEAAKIAEGFVITPTDYIRDADTCFDIATKIRAKAKEGT